MSRRESILLTLLFIAYALLLFYHIGDYPVWNKDEGLYAETVREMIERGNFLDPYFNYEHRWQKPVLIYWVLLPFSYLWGANAFTLRLALVFLSLATLLVTWLFAKRLFRNEQIAFLSAFFLVSSASFILQARHIVTHMLLLFTVMLSFIFLYDLLRGKRDPKTVFLFGASVGLAFLAKLYVGVVFILTTGFLLGAGEIWRHKAAFVKRSLYALLGFALVGLPWYLYMLSRYGDAYVDFLYHEFFDRIGKNVTGKNSPFFYLKVFFGNFAPWSILLLVLALLYLKRFWGTIRETLKSNRELLLVLTAFFVVFVTLSIPKSKLPPYLFYLQGFAAILTALAVYHTSMNRLLRYTIYGIQGLLSVALIAIWILYFDYRSLVFFAFATVTAALWFLKMESLYLGIFRIGVVMLMLYFTVLGNIFDTIQPFFGYQRFGEKIVEIHRHEPKLKFYSLRQMRTSLPFYAQCKVRNVEKLPQENHYILLTSVEDFKPYAKRYRYRVLDRSLFYKRSDSRVWQMLNILKGYRRNDSSRTGELLLLEIEGKRGEEGPSTVNR